MKTTKRKILIMRKEKVKLLLKLESMRLMKNSYKLMKRVKITMI